MDRVSETQLELGVSYPDLIGVLQKNAFHNFNKTPEMYSVITAHICDAVQLCKLYVPCTSSVLAINCILYLQ